MSKCGLCNSDDALLYNDDNEYCESCYQGMKKINPNLLLKRKRRDDKKDTRSNIRRMFDNNTLPEDF